MPFTFKLSQRLARMFASDVVVSAGVLAPPRRLSSVASPATIRLSPLQQMHLPVSGRLPARVRWSRPFALFRNGLLIGALGGLMGCDLQQYKAA